MNKQTQKTFETLLREAESVVKDFASVGSRAFVELDESCRRVRKALASETQAAEHVH